MRGTALVVDDDPALRAAVRRLLEEQGLEVVGEAATAAEAYAAALRLRPGGVLVDVGLPDEHGVALARRLVALPWRPRVLLTSTDPEAVARDVLTLDGITGFLPKQDLPDAPLRHLLAAE